MAELSIEVSIHHRKQHKSLGEHVWTDHRFNFPELLSPEGLARHINDVMTNPSLTMDLERGRTAYVDDNSGTVVISEIPLLQMAVLL